MKYELSEHAKTVMAERRIQTAWLETTILDPTRTEPDADDAELEHRLRTIPERNDRVLRVIINVTIQPMRIVTMYFDRTLRNTL